MFWRGSGILQLPLAALQKAEINLPGVFELGDKRPTPVLKAGPGYLQIPEKPKQGMNKMTELREKWSAICT
jgi:hypothetical protein